MQKSAAEAAQNKAEHLTKTAILDGECARLRKMTAELKDTNGKLVDEVESAKREAQRYKTLEKTAKKLKSDLQAAKKALDEAGRHKRDLEEQATFKETEMRSAFDSETDELQGKVETLENQLRESKETVEKMSKNEERLCAEVSSLMSERDEMREEINTLGEECKREMETTEEVTEELNNRNKELSETLQELANEKEKMIVLSAELNREREDFNTRMETANSAKASLEQDMEKASEQNKTAENRAKDLQSQCVTLEEQLQETTKALAGVDERSTYCRNRRFETKMSYLNATNAFPSWNKGRMSWNLNSRNSKQTNIKYFSTATPPPQRILRQSVQSYKLPWNI